MDLSKQLPTKDQLSKYPWDNLALAEQVPTCDKMRRLFFQQASDANVKGDEEGRLVFQFLGQLCLLYWDSTDANASFSVAVESFDPEVLDLIEELSGACSASALKARFSDIIWVARRKHTFADRASRAYLEIFKKADQAGKWVESIEDLERGMGLARLLGPKKALFLDYKNLIDQRLSELEATCDDAFAARLLGLQIEHRIGDYGVSARIAESIADRLEFDGATFLAQDYYELATRFHQLQSDSDSANMVQLKKGNSLVRLANECVHKLGQGYFAAAHHLASAIECLRRAGEDPNNIKELHLTLLDWQEKARQEMSVHHEDLDISKMVEAAHRSLEGKDLRHSILTMAIGHPPIKKKALSERVLVLTKKHPLSAIFASSMLSDDGRVIARKPGGLSTDAATQEEYLTAEMFRQASEVDWPLRSQAFIDVCRRNIWETHRPRLDELRFLVVHNPFVPPGHELLYLKGILAGFRGEFDVAAHLLVPQIEESIRFVLKGRGIVTSKLDSKLIQEQRLLGTLLSLPETIEMFGEDHIFELRGLLCEKFGYDLRNQLAHGFLTYQGCWSDAVINVWWLVIRFLCIPVATASTHTSHQENVQKPDANNLLQKLCFAENSVAKELLPLAGCRLLRAMPICPELEPDRDEDLSGDVQSEWVDDQLFRLKPAQTELDSLDDATFTVMQAAWPEGFQWVVFDDGSNDECHARTLIEPFLEWANRLSLTFEHDFDLSEAEMNDYLTTEFVSFISQWRLNVFGELTR